MSVPIEREEHPLHIQRTGISQRRDAFTEGEKKLYECLPDKGLEKRDLVDFMHDRADEGDKGELFDALAIGYRDNVDRQEKIDEGLELLKNENPDKKRELEAGIMRRLISWLERGLKLLPAVENKVYDYLLKGGSVPQYLRIYSEEFFIKMSLEKIAGIRDLSLAQADKIKEHLATAEGQRLKEAILIVGERRVLTYQETKLLFDNLMEKLFVENECLDEREEVFFKNNFHPEVAEYILEENENLYASQTEFGVHAEYRDIPNEGQARAELQTRLLSIFETGRRKEMSDCEKEFLLREILSGLQSGKIPTGIQREFVCSILTIDHLPPGAIQPEKHSIAGLIKMSLMQKEEVSFIEKLFLFFEERGSSNTIEEVAKKLNLRDEEKEEMGKIINIRNALVELRRGEADIETEDFLIQEAIDFSGIVRRDRVGERDVKLLDELVEKRSLEIYEKASEELQTNVTGVIKDSKGSEKLYLSTSEMEAERKKYKGSMRTHNPVLSRAFHYRTRLILGKIDRQETLAPVEKQLLALYVPATLYHVLTGNERKMNKQNRMVCCSRKDILDSLLPDMRARFKLDDYTTIFTRLLSDGLFATRKKVITIDQMVQLENEYSRSVSNFIVNYLQSNTSEKKLLAEKMSPELRASLREQLPLDVVDFIEADTLERRNVSPAEERRKEIESSAAFIYVRDYSHEFDADWNVIADYKDDDPEYYYYTLGCKLLMDGKYDDDRTTRFGYDENMGAIECFKQAGDYKLESGPTAAEMLSLAEAQKEMVPDVKAFDVWSANKATLEKQVKERSDILSVYAPLRDVEFNESKLARRMEKKIAEIPGGESSLRFKDQLIELATKEKVDQVGQRTLRDRWTTELTNGLNSLIKIKMDLEVERKQLKKDIRTLDQQAQKTREIHEKYTRIAAIQEEQARVDQLYGELRRRLKLIVKTDTEKIAVKDSGTFNDFKNVFGMGAPCSIDAIDHAKRLADVGYSWTTVAVEMKKMVEQRDPVKEARGFYDWLKANPDEASKMTGDIALVISMLKSQGRPDLQDLINKFESVMHVQVITDHFIKGIAGPRERKVKDKAKYFAFCSALRYAPAAIGLTRGLIGTITQGPWGLLTGVYEVGTAVAVQQVTGAISTDTKKMMLTVIDVYHGKSFTEISKRQAAYDAVRGLGEAVIAAEILATEKNPMRALFNRYRWVAREWWLKIKLSKGLEKVWRIALAVAPIGGVGVAIGILATQPIGWGVLIAAGLIAYGVFWASRRLTAVVDSMTKNTTVKDAKDKVFQERTGKITQEGQLNETLQKNIEEQADNYMKAMANSLKDTDKPDELLAQWEEHAEEFLNEKVSFVNLQIAKIKADLARRFREDVRKEIKEGQRVAIEGEKLEMEVTKKLNRLIETIEDKETIEGWMRIAKTQMNDKELAKMIRACIDERIDDIRAKLRKSFVDSQKAIFVESYVKGETTEQLEARLKEEAEKAVSDFDKKLHKQMQKKGDVFAGDEWTQENITEWRSQINTHLCRPA